MEMIDCSWVGFTFVPPAVSVLNGNLRPLVVNYSPSVFVRDTKAGSRLTQLAVPPKFQVAKDLEEFFEQIGLSRIQTLPETVENKSKLIMIERTAWADACFF